MLGNCNLVASNAAVYLMPNSTTRTPDTDMLYSTTNGQAHNNSTTCCTTKLPHRNARAHHLDMSRCWDVANLCPLVVNFLVQQVVVSSSVGGVVQHVRSRCPSSGVWHLLIVKHCTLIDADCHRLFMRTDFACSAARSLNSVCVTGRARSLAWDSNRDHIVGLQ